MKMFVILLLFHLVEFHFHEFSEHRTRVSRKFALPNGYIWKDKKVLIFLDYVLLY